MNYAILAIGGVALIVIVNWFTWGRYSFVGPVHTST